MFRRHYILNKIATISLLVFMILGIITGFVLCFTLLPLYREGWKIIAYMFIPEVSGGSILISLPGIFILRWIRKDYVEIDNAVKQLTKVEK